MRKVARVDNNHKQIVTDLRKIGCSVWSTAQTGNGFPDIIVGIRNRNYLFEIKNDKNKNKLTEDEQKFFEMWRGQSDVIDCVDDVLNLINENLK